MLLIKQNKKAKGTELKLKSNVHINTLNKIKVKMNEKLKALYKIFYECVKLFYTFSLFFLILF